MSKLLKLKEWLTVPETARHLSIFWGEEVGEADILGFALDGHLTLSVFFANIFPVPHGPIWARCGRVINRDQLSNEKAETIAGFLGEDEMAARGIVWFGDGKYLRLERAILCGAFGL